MGGTINADHTKTIPVDFKGQNATNVMPYRDKKGRLPIQILIEDVISSLLGVNPFEIIEIADCDSKDLQQSHYKEMFDQLDKAQRCNFNRVILVVGTDLATQIGQIVEKKHYPFPLILVTAMEEMSRDLTKTGLFDYYKETLTDGVHNFTSALGGVFQSGVHLLASDGQYYRPSQLRKDFTNKAFVPKG